MANATGNIAIGGRVQWYVKECGNWC